MIYPNDHRPAHVHVIGDGEAVFLLNCPDGPLELRESMGLALHQVNALVESLTPEIPRCCTCWREIHGD
ncbi:MAG: DUF4160 domain-containing protein [Pseudomonadota bacterium]